MTDFAHFPRPGENYPYVLLNTLVLGTNFCRIFDKVAREAAIFILQTSFHKMPKTKHVKKMHAIGLPSPKCPFCRPPDQLAFFDEPVTIFNGFREGTFLNPHRHVEVLCGIRQWFQVSQSRQLAIVIPLQGAKGESLVNFYLQFHCDDVIL